MYTWECKGEEAFENVGEKGEHYRCKVLDPLIREKVFGSREKKKKELTFIGAGIVHSHVACGEDGSTCN